MKNLVVSIDPITAVEELKTAAHSNTVLSLLCTFVYHPLAMRSGLRSGKKASPRPNRSK